MTPIFYIKNGNLSFADKHILQDIEIYVSPGDRVCLVGRNGCGKSSLMKIISSEYELDKGQLFQDPTINIGHLKQELKEVPNKTIYDFILKEFKNPDESKYKVNMILEQMQIDGNSILTECSGGQVRRACLAKSLVSSPDILLLDEPTNHLDVESIEWLEEYLKSYKGAIICISHDRAFQENISNKVWWIDRGEIRKSNKGFKHYDNWREEIIAHEEQQLLKMNRKLEAEKGWLNTGVTARRKRNQKRLANLHRLRESCKAHETHLKNAKSKLRLELAEEENKTKFIIEAKNISYSFPGKKLFNDFSFKVKKGEKIGVIGPNGSGKSTLIKLLTKELEPESGKVKHGTNIDITYFDQQRSELNPNHSLKQTLCPGGGDQVLIRDRHMHVAAYLKKFMFDPKTMEDKVSTLSGGEANRLLLAKSLINPGNFFILDEPTNDLDMDTLEMLLEILADYSGTLIIVSHDRDFLERLVTRTLVFGADKIIDLYGGYNDYLKFYKKKNEIEAAKTKSKASTKNKTNSNKFQERVKNSGKLSYKYTRLLEVLPQEIESIEARLADIEILLSDKDLYAKDVKKFNNLSHELEDLKKQLDAKLQQWIQIEAMKNQTSLTR